MAELMFLSPDFLKREDPVDMSNLPHKCCAKCSEWVESEEIKANIGEPRWGVYQHQKTIFGCGLCCKNSTDEWDAFTWADDCCDNFDPDEDDADV